MVTLDKQIIFDNHKNEYYCEYFSPEIKTFIDNQENSDELHFPTELIQKNSITVPTDFNDKRKNGENDSYICNLIRNDSIDDFIVYINRNNKSVNSIIAPLIFETNKFLLENRPSLIEYSTFYGSIQIFQYLQINNADLPNLNNYIRSDSKYMTVFGSSSLVQNRLTNHKFILEESSDQFKNEDFNKFDILIQTQYPSLIKAKGLNVIEDKRNNEHTTVFLYDYYENGSLSKYIEQKLKGIISTEINTNDYILILGISIGLKYLHDHDIIPVSFIPKSILIDDNFYPIISYFELSKIKLDQYLFSEEEYSNKRTLYTPPEVFVGYEFFKSSNIYSLSFMIYQILTGKV